MSDDKRKHGRCDTLNLLSYECIDEEGGQLAKGMGRILDISHGGVNLETHVPVEIKDVVLMKIAFGDEIVDIKGEVRFCGEMESKMYESGVRFLESNDRLNQVIDEL